MAYHPHPHCRLLFASSSISPVNQINPDHIFLEEAQICHTVSVPYRNTVTQLSAYQAEILEEMGRQLDSQNPNPLLWDGICVVNNLLLHSSKRSAQGCEHVLGLAVTPERALWLNLFCLTFSQKAKIMDAAYDPTKGLFGPAMEKMCETSTHIKHEGETFDLTMQDSVTPTTASHCLTEACSLTQSPQSLPSSIKRRRGGSSPMVQSLEAPIVQCSPEALSQSLSPQFWTGETQGPVTRCYQAPSHPPQIPKVC